MKRNWKQASLVFLALPLAAMGEVEVHPSREVTGPSEITAKFIHETNPERGALQVRISDKEGVKSVAAIVERRRRGSPQMMAWDSWSALKESDAGVYEVAHPGKVEPLEVVVFIWMESVGHLYTFTPGSAAPKTVESKSVAEWEPPNKPKVETPFRYPLEAHRGRLGQGTRYTYGGIYPYDPQAQKLADELALIVQSRDGRRYNERVRNLLASSNAAAVVVMPGVSDTVALESLLKKARGSSFRGYARKEFSGGNEAVWVALP